MPGPNSSPAGDVRLVRGHIGEEFVVIRYGTCNRCYAQYVASVPEDQEPEPYIMLPLREHLARHGNLVTGKTANKRA